MKITLNYLNLLAIERRIQLSPWVLCSPGNTYTLEKNLHRSLAMTGYFCSYSDNLYNWKTMEIENPEALNF